MPQWRTSKTINGLPVVCLTSSTSAHPIPFRGAVQQSFTLSVCGATVEAVAAMAERVINAAIHQGDET